MPIAVLSEDMDCAEGALAGLLANTITMRNAVATAIATQREKSAKIAESFTREHGAVAKKIAEMIRKNQFE